MALFRSRDPIQRHQQAIADLPWVRDPAPIDDTYGDPLAVHVADALDRSDLARTMELLEAAPARRRRCVWSHRVLPPTAERVETALAWTQQEPRHGMVHLLAGYLMVEWAWHARGGGYASTVEPDAWGTFHQRLDRAETLLVTAADLAPGSTEPWVELIAVSMGQSYPIEVAYQCFEEAQAREAWEPTACGAMIQRLAPKWGGSEDQMFGFARKVVASAPPASPARSVLPMAYLEVVVQRMRDLPIDRAVEVLQGPLVGEELQAAAEQSIFHREYLADARGLRSADTFLVAFYQGDHDLLTHRTLGLLSGRYGSSPFDYFGNSGRMHRKCEILTAKALNPFG